MLVVPVFHHKQRHIDDASMPPPCWTDGRTDPVERYYLSDMPQIDPISTFNRTQLKIRGRCSLISHYLPLSQETRCCPQTVYRSGPRVWQTDWTQTDSLAAAHLKGWSSFQAHLSLQSSNNRSAQ